MSTLLYSDARECRRPETEVLPDARKRLTRFFELPNAEIPDELNVAWGTIDGFPQDDLPDEWKGLRLVGRKVTDQVAPPGRDSRPLLILVFEQIDATAETPVGGVEWETLEDGRLAKVLSAVQFSAGTYTATPAGTALGGGYFLLKEEATNDGTLRRLRRTYVNTGVVRQSDETRNNGALLLRTIVSVLTEPSTPAGYTLVSQDRPNLNGVAGYSYTFAKGNGQIAYDPSARNNGALLLVSIRHLTAPGASNPITTPAGYTLVEGPAFSEADGHRIWSASFAKGEGVVSTQTDYQEGNLQIASTVTLVLAGGADPALPSNCLSREKREADGYKIFTDRYIAAGSGQIDYTERTREDGSTEATITEIGNAAATPATPAGFYAVAVRNLKQPGGYFRNIGTYVKQPADRTFKRTVDFGMPGLAYVGGGQLVLTPPCTRTVLADVAVSYSTAQDTTAPFSVTNYAAFYEAYKRHEDGQQFTSQRGLGGYLGDSSWVGSNANYNGVLCDTFVAQVVASSPTTRPTGLTVISNNNEIYLVALDGTVVYRRVKVSYAF